MDIEPTATVAVAEDTLPPQAEVRSEVLPASRDNGPILMSFPAILRTPGLSDRFAHLRAGLSRSEGAPSSPLTASRKNRDDKAGKKWVRRKDNARFVGNPHVVAASPKDYNVAPPSNRSTFPEPLPVYLSRHTSAPSAQPVTREPYSANAGRFSLSLKGMRRDLRKSGPRAEQLVKEVEGEMLSWLRNGGVLMNPDTAVSAFVNSISGTPIGTTGSITEVSRTPLQLVWAISEDAFARYVVHCCARYHSVVSFSKDTSGQRLTYLLRPNVTRPDYLASAAVATPPVTESELSSFEVESDFIDTDNHSDIISLPDHDSDSDMEGAPPRARDVLSDIAESTPGSPNFGTSHPPPPRSVDGWMVLDDPTAGDGDESAGDELASSVGSLSMQDSIADRMPRAIAPNLRQTPLRSHPWSQQRSASSPSRSPARRVPPRPFPRVEPPTVKLVAQSFYEYLFA